MKQLWAPWRLDYILGSKAGTCPFCIPQNKQEDAERLILYRGKFAFVLMNKFPYNNGHLLVTPYRHVMELTDLNSDESHEVMDLLQKSSTALSRHCSPEGVNIGANVGSAAGAGIGGHLHFHVVPRWNGDSSFIAVLDEVRVVPQHVQTTYQELLTIFKKLG